MSPSQESEALTFEEATKQQPPVTVARCTGCALGYLTFNPQQGEAFDCLRCGEDVLRLDHEWWSK